MTPLKKKKILIVCELGAHLGHLLRLLPVAKSLNARGHKITWAIPDVQAAVGLVGMAFDLIQCPVDKPVAQAAPRSYAEILACYAFRSDDALDAALGDWSMFLGRVQPDVMLVDFSNLALLAGRLARIPMVHLAIGWEAPPARPALPVFPPFKDEAERAAKLLELEIVARINKRCRTAGVAELNVLGELYTGGKQLLATLPEFDHFGSRTGRYVGPLFSEDFGVPVDWRKPFDVAIPRVFVYLQPHVSNDSVFWALQACSAQVVAVLPGAEDGDLLRLYGNGFHVSREPVALGSILKTADLVISNGGHGLVAASLLAGVPVLLFPATVEQEILAGQLVKTRAVQSFRRVCAFTQDQNPVDLALKDPRMKCAADALAMKYAHCTQSSVIQQVVEELEKT